MGPRTPLDTDATTCWPGWRRWDVDVVATGNVHYAAPGRPGWPAPWPPSGPGGPWPRWTAGCPRPGRLPALGRGAGAVASPLARGGGADRRAGPGLRLRLPPGRAPAARLPRPRRAYTRELPGELVTGGPPRATGRRGDERVPGAYAQIDQELDVIERLGFPGYFLIVHDIVEFCEQQNIFCQGRGSAANSAVCLRARHHQRRPGRASACCSSGSCPTAGTGRPTSTWTSSTAPRGGHPVRLRPLRPGPGRPGRQRDHLPAAAGAAGRRPGPRFTPEQSDAWVRRIGPGPAARGGGAGATATGRPDVPAAVAELAAADAAAAAPPRHPLRRHGDLRPAGGGGVPGGVGPDAGRTVLQWDKDDCAYAGLVKFDLLGLGMLAALHDCFDLVAKHLRRALDDGHDPAGGPGRLPDAAGPTRWACSRSSPAPRWPPCPGCGRRSSTTWSSRWR